VAANNLQLLEIIQVNATVRSKNPLASNERELDKQRGRSSVIEHLYLWEIGK